jgi:hypothetical protein
MPKLDTRSAEQIRQARERILNNLATQVGSSLEEIRNGRATEDTARATIAPATRKAAKFDLGEFIRTVKQIPDGKYALVGKDGETVHFFEVVERGNRNWVNRLFGSPGDFRSERMSYQWMHAAATRIAADPKAAAILFGRETRTCGRCSSPLTNAESRARGLGPKCAMVY